LIPAEAEVGPFGYAQGPVSFWRRVFTNMNI
jgi:hypothetical protein